MWFHHRISGTREHSGGNPKAAHGSPAEDLYGATVLGHVLGTGNPGDEDKELGVSFTIRRTDRFNQSALVHVTPAQR